MQRRFTLSVRKGGATSRVGPGRPARSDAPSVPQPPVATPPPPPPPSPLDLVLQKAATKQRLAHPAAPPPKEPEPVSAPAKAPAKASPAARGPPKQQQQRTQDKPPRKQQQQQGPQQQQSGSGSGKRAASMVNVDDDALLAGITEAERDKVWDELRMAVEGGDGDDAWDDVDDSSAATASLARRRAAPASARDDRPSGSSRGTASTSSSSSSASSASLSSSSSVGQGPLASSSGFKGFGSPPAARTTAPSPLPAAASTTARGLVPSAPPPSSAEAASTSGRGASSSGSGKQGQQRKGPLRVFLFNAEEAKTRVLLEEIGMAGRVEVVGDLRSAEAILAAKLSTRSGKHVNLVQGEKTAANAGIPFIVVGRNLTAENLKSGLEQLLNPNSEAAVAARAKAAAARVPTAAELQAARYDMFTGFGHMVAAPPPQMVAAVAAAEVAEAAADTPAL